jgi:glutathione synthase/RimK-type ligase-like ATP-grasp enzyme
MRLEKARHYCLLRNAAKEALPWHFPEHRPYEEDPELELADRVVIDWPPDVPKPLVGLVPDTDPSPYWTKYRRLLQTNGIPFEIYDIHRSTWLRDAEPFDLVVWRPMSYPHELEESRRKFSLIASELGIPCWPSLANLLLYEDKLLQYEELVYHGLPVVDTFVSHSRDEVMQYLSTCDYPLVWKIAAGSGSLGVELVRSRQAALRFARRVFDFSGRRTYWPFVRQKNYVYLQKFIPGAGPDVRVVMVGGSMAFGFYRQVPKGDFRASGMSTRVYGALPEEALLLARRVAKALDLPFVAVDMLNDASASAFRIIEVSPIMGIFWLDQLRVDGIPGAYVFDGPGGGYRFVPMRVWTQELALKGFIETYWLKAGSPPRGTHEV